MNYSCSQKKKGTEKVPSFAVYGLLTFQTQMGLYRMDKRYLRR